MHIVLYEPVIPQNTGSIARLCACTGATLHLIHPLGFKTDEASVKRAGLDYWPFVNINEHNNFEDFLTSEKPKNFFFLSKFATKSFYELKIEKDSYLIFGSETKGLSTQIKERYPEKLFKIPMRTQLVRSLNLAQAAAIVLYEGLRQNEFLQCFHDPIK